MGEVTHFKSGKDSYLKFGSQTGMASTIQGAMWPYFKFWAPSCFCSR